MENYKDLEEMRQQMAILKSKLETQEIINDRMLRNAMNERVGWINRCYNWSIILTLFVAAPYCWWVFKYIGMSTAFAIATELLLLYCVGYTFWCGRPLRDKHLMQGDLLHVASTVAKAKKRDSDWLMQGIPLLIIWFVWFVYEIHLEYGHYHLVVPGIIGGLIGGGIGFSIHLKTQRKYKEILEHIENMRD